MQDPIAVTLSQIREIKSVSCGTAHTLVLSDTGFVFAIGDNSYGQLGISSAQLSSSRQPFMVKEQAPRPSFVTSQVICSQNSSFALHKTESAKMADELYSWGSS